MAQKHAVVAFDSVVAPLVCRSAAKHTKIDSIWTVHETKIPIVRSYLIVVFVVVIFLFRFVSPLRYRPVKILGPINPIPTNAPRARRSGIELRTIKLLFPDSGYLFSPTKRLPTVTNYRPPSHGSLKHSKTNYSGGWGGFSWTLLCGSNESQTIASCFPGLPRLSTPAPKARSANLTQCCCCWLAGWLPISLVCRW